MGATDSQTEKNFNQVVVGLKSVEASRENSNVKENLALYTSRGRGRGKFRGNFNVRGRNYSMRANNNYTRDNNNNYNENRKNERKDIKCYNCGRSGHIARNCRSNHRNQTTTNNINNQYETKYDNKSDRGKKIALPVFSNPCNDKFVWCVDSGCAVHMCNDLELFKTYRHVEPIMLTVGNSDIMSSDIVGEVNLVSICENIKHVLCLTNVYYIPVVPYNLLSLKAFKTKM